MLPKTLVFVDTETTGLSLQRDRIIEIGLLRVENDTVVKTFKTLLNPETYISPMIQSMTGISKEALENAPSFYEMKDELIELMNDAVFVAHNVRFDYGFLRNEFKRAGMSFSSKHFCTVKLSKYLFPGLKRYNLDTIIEQFGISCARRHRAFDDAKVLWDFYQIAKEKVGIDNFLSAVNLALKKPSLPVGLSKDIVDSLPESPGVYIFYGAQGTPLYIGKSINIRERVLSHFANDHTSSTEMKIAQQIEHIELIKTSGELGALVKEAMLIKKMQPLYNRKLRINRKLIILKSFTNTKGYDQITLDTLDGIDHKELGNMLGVFRSQRQAKEFLIGIAKKHMLCEKLLCLEKTKTACFSYRLGNCKGACIGKEHPLRYHIRFLEAFSKNKIKPWPFKGPILIKEKNEFDNTIETFIVDKWCLLGSVNSSDNTENDKYSNTYLFDVDTYKILCQYLLNQKNALHIQTISHGQLQELL